MTADRACDSVRDRRSHTVEHLCRSGRWVRAGRIGSGDDPVHPGLSGSPRPYSQVPPVQGLVLEWRRRCYRWNNRGQRPSRRGRPVVVQEWAEAHRIRPVGSDPTKQLGC
ncbi:hypothetical protein GCM10009616_31310 [Microlunatus lacustris]